MKFLPLRSFDSLSKSLNFPSPLANCYVTGGIDMYTTKAASSEKKLFRDIEQDLDSRYELDLAAIRARSSNSPPATRVTAASPPAMASTSSVLSDKKGQHENASFHVDDVKEPTAVVESPIEFKAGEKTGGIENKPSLSTTSKPKTESTKLKPKKQTSRSRSGNRRKLSPVNSRQKHRSGTSIPISRSAPVNCNSIVGHSPPLLPEYNSPFGNLALATSRRAFSNLIAVLNSSHPDYDFSSVLRPSNFKRERSVKSVMASVNSTLLNLSHPLPSLWIVMDEELELHDCECFSLDGAIMESLLTNVGEEEVVWSLNYFFVSKERKRVAYLNLRGLSNATSMTPGAARRMDVYTPAGKRNISGDFVAYRGGPTKAARSSYFDEDMDDSSPDEMGSSPRVLEYDLMDYSDIEDDSQFGRGRLGQLPAWQEDRGGEELSFGMEV